jgi:hypothetical protein
LLAGFGLGGLLVLTLVLFADGTIAPLRTAAHRTASPTPSLASPAPTPAATPASAGQPEAGGAMAYDAENHGVILFGGTSGENSTDETWLWQGRAWSKLEAQGPPARSGEMMAYDSAHHQLVMFGGAGPRGAGQGLLFQDTWTWDGSTWQLQHPAHMPNPRMRAAFAFDERRGVVVMFGGEGEGTTTYNATWTWDGVDWTLQEPATAPPVRHFATMAFDGARGVTVLFGGSMFGARLNDTWTWDGVNWTEEPGPGPAGRGWSTLAYDAATQQVVAYVYFSLDNNPLSEYTMTWDGTKWTDRTTGSDPSPRAETRMSYDPETRLAVLYGPGTETWTWDGQNWSLWRAGGAE